MDSGTVTLTIVCGASKAIYRLEFGPGTENPTVIIEQDSRVKIELVGVERDWGTANAAD